ncbi:MAG: endonuclease/exonuclease/phosphatase family protein [Pedobacter sp.]|jgi:endonuclease/exonuclease/phosphatase family metal-dependent hydrolase|uniref:endonuclease/exonuclease/phosphatase family protein n=1 Tax=Pedobacter sp. TaxID=1411316 RepID=UPI0035699BEA
MKKLTVLIFVMLSMMATVGFAQQKALTTIKVLSYNIHHANPPSKPNLIDIDAVAKVIAAHNPDFVALQEVDVNTKRSGQQINEAQQLAAKLKMYYFFAKAIDYAGGDYGVAILSKYKILDSASYKLKSNPIGNPEARTLAIVKVKLDNKEISFACTHLDAERDTVSRMLQIAQINKIVKKEKGLLFIAGDFNAEENTSVIKEFEKTFTKSCNNCEFTFPNIQPNKTIDYIGFKKNKRIVVTSHQVLNENYASDHLPIMATFSIH